MPRSVTPLAKKKERRDENLDLWRSVSVVSQATFEFFGYEFVAAAIQPIARPRVATEMARQYKMRCANANATQRACKVEPWNTGFVTMAFLFALCLILPSWEY